MYCAKVMQNNSDEIQQILMQISDILNKTKFLWTRNESSNGLLFELIQNFEVPSESLHKVLFR